jgi:hypothetical protein
MNKYHVVTIFIAAAVALLMLLLPPYDYPNPFYNVPNFNGFFPVFGDHPNRMINAGFLSIEIFTALISSPIVWLLLGERARLHRKLKLRDLVLMGVCEFVAGAVVSTISGSLHGIHGAAAYIR